MFRGALNTSSIIIIVTVEYFLGAMLSTLSILSIDPHSSCYTSYFQVTTARVGKVKWLVQGHTSRKQQGQGSAHVWTAPKLERERWLLVLSLRVSAAALLQREVLRRALQNPGQGVRAERRLRAVSPLHPSLS